MRFSIGGPGHLAKTRVSSAYRHYLARSWKVAKLWFSLRGIRFPSIVHLPREADKLLSQFVEEAHQQRIAFHIVKHAVLHAQFKYPHLRRHLPGTWSCLKSWQASKPWTPRRPMHRHAMLNAFLRALDHAMRAPTLQASFRWLVLGLFIRLGFWGLLRPGEMYRLTPAHISIIRRTGEPTVLVISITEPKTKRFGGRVQFSVVYDAGTVLWIEYLCLIAPKGQALWTGTGNLFRSMFAALMEEASLTILKYSPASLRSGGATDMFRSGITIERLKFLGRWKSLNTLVACIQEGVGYLNWSLLPLVTQAELLQRITRYQSVLDFPPRRPWSDLRSQLS